MASNIFFESAKIQKRTTSTILNSAETIKLLIKQQIEFG